MNGESDAQSLWCNGIQALGVPGASNLKKEYAHIFEKIKKVYVHDEGDQGGKTFIEKACKVIPYEKLYIISARRISNECKDISDLHVKNLLNFETLIASAQQVNKNYYDEVNSSSIDESENKFEFEEEPAEHVIIAEEIMSQLYIKYYKEDFYVYDNRRIS